MKKRVRIKQYKEQHTQEVGTYLICQKRPLKAHTDKSSGARGPNLHLQPYFVNVSSGNE